MTTKDKRITVRLTADDRRWLHQIGGGDGRGALQEGFETLLAFAKLTPQGFETFVWERRHARGERR
jgi:hypothetical protein